MIHTHTHENMLVHILEHASACMEIQIYGYYLRHIQFVF
jgi:hypothetical protein